MNSSEKKFLIIKSFLDTDPRNKIILHNKNDIESIDIGFMFSEKISSILDDKRLSLKAKERLDHILTNIMENDPKLGKFISISNLGILFEQELKIDFNQFLDQYSKNNLLFAKWEGEIEDNVLYFLTKENGVKINIENLNYIILGEK